MKKLAFLVAASLVVGCGGGGGGEGPQPLYQIPYTGVSNEALITDNNAVRIVEGAFFGPELPSGSVSPLSAESYGSSSARQRNIIPGFLRDTVRNGLKRSVERPHPKSPSSSAAVTDEWTDPGQCGGTASYSVTVNDVTGDFNGSVTFRDYNDCESVTSGSTNVSGNIDPQMLGYRWLQLQFGIITVVSGEESFSMSGTVLSDWRVIPSTATLNLRVRNDGTGEVFWYEDYVTTEGMSGSYMEMTISGIFYDPAYGYVTLTTDNVFRNYSYMTYPMEGALRAAGAKGTASWLIAADSSLHRVEADTDGDGTVDFVSPTAHWPGENRNPGVAITGDSRGNVGCTVTLDSSGSYDPDADPLTFRWRIISAPAGSTAGFVNASAPRPTFVPDLRGDYVIELAVSDGYAEAVSTYGPVSIGGGLFCSANGSGFVAVGSSARAVAVGDVNGDGRKDVVFVTDYYDSPDNDGKLFVLLQDGSGGLSPPVRYELPANYSNRPTSVVVGDVNGDGRHDVAVGLDRNGIEIFLQDSGGGLQPARFIAALDSSFIRVADLNNDGRMDLAGIGSGTNTVTVWIQDTTGNLGDPVTYGVNHGGWDDLELGDVSGDGRTDVIVMSGQSLYDDFGALLQSPTGMLDNAVYYNLVEGSLPSGLAIGDVNGDARGDVVLSHPGGISLFHQAASGTLNPPVSYPLFSSGSGDVAVGDFNTDGRKDVVGGYGGTGVGVFFQRLDGTLAPHDLYWTTSYPVGAITVGDIDGDGRDDVVAGVGNGIVIFRNTGRI